jgi:glycosyltransferase involved in cell wall biosynthesis
MPSELCLVGIFIAIFNPIMLLLSAVIITHNEERNICRCINSLHDLVSEVVVVDSFSNDKTKEICLGFSKVRFIEHHFEGHIQQKNFALDQAQNDVVLSLDADEALSDALRDSIKKIDFLNLAPAYSFNRLSNYCGQWIRHGSWYPDVKLRLFNRRMVRWKGVNPHDKAELLKGGKVVHLKGDLLHYTFSSIEEHIQKLDYFSNLAAKAYLEKGRTASFFNLRIRPPFAFFRDYVLRMGFLDGHNGFVIARNTAQYTFDKYSKLRQLLLNSTRS